MKILDQQDGGEDRMDSEFRNVHIKWCECNKVGVVWREESDENEFSNMQQPAETNEDQRARRVHWHEQHFGIFRNQNTEDAERPKRLADNTTNQKSKDTDPDIALMTGELLSFAEMFKATERTSDTANITTTIGLCTAW